MVYVINLEVDQIQIAAQDILKKIQHVKNVIIQYVLPALDLLLGVQMNALITVYYVISMLFVKIVNLVIKIMEILVLFVNKGIFGMIKIVKNAIKHVPPVKMLISVLYLVHKIVFPVTCQNVQTVMKGISYRKVNAFCHQIAHQDNTIIKQ